jgi:hypothetical protein
LYKNNQLINLRNQITTTTTNFKMNATNNNNNNNNKKPFCKVCADAGKTDTAHYVRLTPDPKSPVVCPTLLALECRYCFKSGHTVKYCAVAKKNNKLRTNRDRDRDRDRHTTTTTNNTTTQDKPPTNSKFAVLLEDDEEDNNNNNNNNNNMEPHATTSTTTQINNNNTWASIAKNTTKNTVQPVNNAYMDNYQYHCWAEDYSRSPNLQAWLVEPSVQQLQLQEEQQELQQEQEELTLADKYGDRLYHVLYEYFKNEFHRERTATVVDRLIECSSEEELEEFMSNRLYLEECADEIFTALKQFDPPAKGYLHLTEVEDW